MYWAFRSVVCPRSEVCSYYRSAMKTAGRKPAVLCSCGVSTLRSAAIRPGRARDHETLKLGRVMSAECGRLDPRCRNMSREADIANADRHSCDPHKLGSHENL